MWDEKELLEGYFYVLKCTTKENKVGIMYGISINPYGRLDSHLNYNLKIGTKTELLGLYKNKKEISKAVVLQLESDVKRNIGKNFFAKSECSTNTETLNTIDLSKLMAEIERYGLIQEEDEMLMNAIRNLFNKKGLGDL